MQRVYIQRPLTRLLSRQQTLASLHLNRKPLTLYRYHHQLYTFNTAMSSKNIPKTQTAAVVGTGGIESLEVKTDYPVRQPEDLAPGECLVEMECTGVCHTDLHAAKGDWPVPSKTPLVGGHEGVGRIVAIGAHTTNSPVKLGDRVGIKWLADSCLQCEICRKGLEQSA